MQPYNRREFLAYSRISAAAVLERNLDDLPFRVGTKSFIDAGRQQQIRIELQIDPSRVEFRKVDDRHTASLKVALFSANSKGDFLGEDWMNAGFRLKEDTYQRYLASTIAFSGTIPRRGATHILKVIVYDLGGDGVCSKLVKMR